MEAAPAANFIQQKNRFQCSNQLHCVRLITINWSAIIKTFQFEKTRSGLQTFFPAALEMVIISSLRASHNDGAAAPDLLSWETTPFQWYQLISCNQDSRLPVIHPQNSYCSNNDILVKHCGIFLIFLLTTDYLGLIALFSENKIVVDETISSRKSSNWPSIKNKIKWQQYHFF